MHVLTLQGKTRDENLFIDFKVFPPLKKAWDAISNQLQKISFRKISFNCFRKSGISEKDGEKAMNDEEDPFKGLEDHDVEEHPVQTLRADLSILKERFADQIEADI